MNETAVSSSTPLRSYTAPAKVLHWLMALIIISVWFIGLYGASLSYQHGPAETAQKIWWITFHKEIATTTIFLIVLRIVWRATHRPPELTGMSPVMVMAAHLGHVLLYVLMIAVPLLGWANSSSAGYDIPVLGLFHLPTLMDKNELLTPTLSLLHKIVAYVLGLVVLGHAAFALKHHFIDKDDTIRSMLPSSKS